MSADAVPALEVCYLGWDVVLTTDRPRQAIDTVFLRDDMELSIEPVGDPGRGGRDHDRVGLCASSRVKGVQAHPGIAQHRRDLRRRIRGLVIEMIARAK